MEKQWKKKRFSIPEYDVDVEFARNIIQVLDCTTDKLLDTCNMEEKELIELDHVVRRSFSSFKAQSNSGKNYLVNLNFVQEHSILATGGEYILDICMTSPYHGFYFGLYEIGEFGIDSDDLTMHKIRSYPIHYVGSGVVPSGTVVEAEEKEMFFGLRESEGNSVEGPHRYFVVKLIWSSKSGVPPKIEWKKSVSAAVISMCAAHGLLFVGLKNGDLIILDLATDISQTRKLSESEIITYKGTRYRVIEKEKKESGSKEIKIERVLEEVEFDEGPNVVFNQKIFQENLKNGDKKEGEVTTIEYLPESHRVAIIGGVRQHFGGVAIFSYEGTLLLNSRLGNSILKGIYQTSEGLFLLNTTGLLYQVVSDITNESSAQHILKVQLGKEIMSNITIVRDWVCYSSAANLSFIFTRDTTKRSSMYLADTLARCVKGHDFGVITGDDLGKIRFWKIGNLEINEE